MRAACVFLVLLVALPAVAQETPKIAVLALETPPAMDEHTAKLLDELLLTEVQGAGDYEVFGSADIAAMISLEEERVKVTGCADDACLVEIGGALGVSLLVASSLGTVGERHLVNVKVLDVDTARVLGRSSESAIGGQSELIDALESAVAKAMATVDRKWRSGDGPAGAGAPASSPPTVTAAAEAPTSGLTVGAWVALGVAVAAAGTGAALLGLGFADGAEQEDEFRGTDRWRDLKGSAETKLTAGGAVLGVAGAAAVVGLVLFLLPDDAGASAGVAPTPGGAAATIGFGF